MSRSACWRLKGSGSVAGFAFELDGGGGFGDDALEVGDFFGVHAVFDILEGVLGALDGGLGAGDIDFRFFQCHIGEDDDLGLGDFSEARADGECDHPALVQVAEFAGFEGGHQSRVEWQDADFPIRARQIDMVHLVRENLFFGGDDIEEEGHGGLGISNFKFQI